MFRIFALIVSVYLVLGTIFSFWGEILVEMERLIREVIICVKDACLGKLCGSAKCVSKKASWSSVKRLRVY